MASPSVSPSKRSGGVVSVTAQQMRASAPATPLDYSFMGLATLLDMTRNDPVGGKKKTAVAAPGSPSEASQADVDSPGLSPTRHRKPTRSAVSLRVNNNKIVDLSDMDEALEAVFEDPSQLQWLDLSGNALTSIPAQAFAKYPNVFTLHLHGNKLAKYTDIDHLAACLPNLHALALHGNPLEEKKHYRSYVISSFPNLKQLDFSCVTNGDREKAATWATIYKAALHASRTKGKHPKETDFE